MKLKINHKIVLFVVLLMFTAGCAASKPKVGGLSVTFSNDRCSYSGDSSVAAGDVSTTAVVKSSDFDISLVILTVDEGRTINDFKTISAQAGPPDWSHRVADVSWHVKDGESYTTKLKIDSGPIYIVCFMRNPDAIIGVIGPITVTK